MDLDVLVILPKGVSCPEFESASYEEYFGLEKKYTENTELIDGQYLDWLHEAAQSNQAIMHQDSPAV